MRARLEIDGREHPLAPRSGLQFEARGELAPPLFDARDAFGSLSATLAGYVTVLPGRGITLAARIGAERSIGDAPFHAKAYLGGERTVRGYTAERFVGDASVYANTEIRFPLGTVFVLAPIEVGGFLLADVGRVFLEGETSSVWHGTGGAGLTLAPFGRDYLAMFYVARGDTLRIRSGLGFMF
jgi:outer membrane protein assembly factor BamA